MVAGFVAETEDSLLVVKGDAESEALVLVSLSLKAVVCKLYGGLRTAEDYALSVNGKRECAAGESVVLKSRTRALAALAEDVVL